MELITLSQTLATIPSHHLQFYLDTSLSACNSAVCILKYLYLFQFYVILIMKQNSLVFISNFQLYINCESKINILFMYLGELLVLKASCRVATKE